MNYEKSTGRKEGGVLTDVQRRIARIFIAQLAAKATPTTHVWLPRWIMAIMIDV